MVRPSVSPVSLIALDWGTTNVRGYLLGPRGATIAAREARSGLMHTPPGGFAEVFSQLCGDWLDDHPRAAVIASGMVGSAQGWREAPYVDCPAAVDELGRSLIAVDTGRGRTVHIVPGVAQRSGRCDVMRGEETQIAGILASLPDLNGGCTLVLPGTHSKWAVIQSGCIVRFTTYMTGELFAVLVSHSILGKSNGTVSERPAAGFLAGIDAAREPGAGGISELLFSARARVVLGEMPREAALDFLSGLLIGDEIRSALKSYNPAMPLVIVADEDLANRYQVALRCFGCSAIVAAPDAAPLGLWSIASHAGLVSPDTKGSVHDE